MCPFAWFPHLKTILSRDESGLDEMTATEDGEVKAAEEEIAVVGVPLGRETAAEFCAVVLDNTRTSCVECVLFTPEVAEGGTESDNGPPSRSQPCVLWLLFWPPDKKCGGCCV